MEEKKVNLSTFIILMVILTIIILGLIVYIIIGKVQPNNKNELLNNDIKIAFQRYLTIKGYLSSSPSDLVAFLFDDAIINQNDDNNEQYLETNIKYVRFEKTILDYMTIDEFQRINTSDYNMDYFKNVDGILYVANIGDTMNNWKVNSIEKKSSKTYIGHTTWEFEEETGDNVDFEFKIEQNNNRSVISFCKSK